MAAIFNYSSTYTKQSYMFKKFARNERVSDATKTIDSSLILLIRRACHHNFVMVSSLA